MDTSPASGEESPVPSPNERPELTPEGDTPMPKRLSAFLLFADVPVRVGVLNLPHERDHEGRKCIRVAADLILQGHSDLIDAKQLSVERFATGELLHESAVL